MITGINIHPATGDEISAEVVQNAELGNYIRVRIGKNFTMFPSWEKAVELQAALGEVLKQWPVEPPTKAAPVKPIVCGCVHDTSNNPNVENLLADKECSLCEGTGFNPPDHFR